MKRRLKDYLHEFSPTRTIEIQADMSLQELRKTRQKSQQEIAAKLNVNQAEISKMERRPDMYVSTLVNFVHALGGSLEIIVKFPDACPVRINQFALLDLEPSTHEVLARVERAVMSDDLAAQAGSKINSCWSFAPENEVSEEMNLGTFSFVVTGDEDWFQHRVYHSS